MSADQVRESSEHYFDTTHDAISTSSGQNTVVEFNEKQTRVLRALCSAFIGELNEEKLQTLAKTDAKVAQTCPRDIEAFGKHNLGNDFQFVDALVQRINLVVHPDKISSVRRVLTALSKGIAAFRLTGYNKPFYDLTQQQRESVLAKWSTSNNATHRKIYRLFLLLILHTFWLDSRQFYPAIGYPGPDPGVRAGSKVQQPKYEFIDVPEDGLELPLQDEKEIDVVIVGSGAGGSVAAAQLAQDGYRVIVLEKGNHYEQEEITLEQKDALHNMYEAHGALSSDDNSVSFLAGSVFGGGTTVNWSASQEPPHYVREEWSEQGLARFLSEDFRKSMSSITWRSGVSTIASIKHNNSNNMLIEGCKKLGYPWEAVPQNTASREHNCGWCGFGCRYGKKQSTVMTFLKNARDSNAEFIKECYVEQILFENNKDRPKYKRVVGVEAKVQGNRRLTIRCKKVVVAAGAIHSPALLLRSGLKNKNIGRNLHVHPVATVHGVFPQKDIKTYEGAILTTVSNVVDNIDGKHYGAKIEVGSFHPAYACVNIPWRSSLKHKQAMIELNHIVPLTVTARDRDSGRVVIDDKGRPIVNYTLSAYDAKNMVAGTISALNILVAAGAKKVSTCQYGIDEFEPREQDPMSDPEYQKFIEKVKKVGFAPNAASISSIHQMGSCKMGNSQNNSVVDSTGETWEAESLYVADASVFPTATGVSPMLTVMSAGHFIAKCIYEKSVEDGEAPKRQKRYSNFSIFGSFGSSANGSSHETSDVSESNTEEPGEKKKRRQSLGARIINRTFSM